MPGSYSIVGVEPASIVVDRDPSNVVIMVSLQLAPHTLTIRDTYTVPAGRSAFLNSIFLETYITTAPSSVGSTRIVVTLNQTTLGVGHIFELYRHTNAVDAEKSGSISPEFLLVAGDVVRILTIDNSVGGNVRYNASVIFTEFDA